MKNATASMRGTDTAPGEQVTSWRVETRRARTVRHARTAALLLASWAAVAAITATITRGHETADHTPHRTGNPSFLAELHAAGITGKDVPLIGYGHEVCADLDAGWTPDRIGRLGFTGRDAATLIGAAVTNLCPQHATGGAR
jgi:hypothetical protein